MRLFICVRSLLTLVLVLSANAYSAELIEGKAFELIKDKLSKEKGMFALFLPQAKFTEYSFDLDYIESLSWYRLGVLSIGYKEDDFVGVKSIYKYNKESMERLYSMRENKKTSMKN